MFMSAIKALKMVTVSFMVAGMLWVGFILLTSPKAHHSAFTHEEVAKINPVMIIDWRTLLDVDRYSEARAEALDRLYERGVLLYTPVGPVVNPTLSNYSVSVIIQSSGGQVTLGNKTLEIFQPIKDSGIKINCYVGEAQSMAFHVMVSMCDKVVAKRGSRLMQHRTSCGVACQTPSTYQSDIEMSRKEAQALGLRYDLWHEVARGPEDHVFNLIEIEKYKLVDEWID